MAGPNRPDESPKDFSFLNSDPAIPEHPSFPTFGDAAPTALPEINFDSSPAQIPDLSGIMAEPVSFSSPPLPVSSGGQTADNAAVTMATAEAQEVAEHLETPPVQIPDATVAEPTSEPLQSNSEPTSASVPERESTTIVRPETPVAPSSANPVADDSKVPEKPASEKQSSVIVERKSSSAVNGYALAITVLLIFCLMTGRLKLFGNAALESLPDIRPLDANEFRRVPDGTPVPEGHVLKLGESRRFGDVVLTPVKVTREPLMFEQFQTKAPATTLTTDPVLKLWLRFENRSGSYAFPPFDAGLMSHRTPRFSTDESTIVNSMLNVNSPGTSSPVRVLNFLQTMDNAFVIVGQQSGKVIVPDETFETFIACSEDIQYITPSAETGYTWRVQFRKGVHTTSGHGVTTLVDIMFSEAEITTANPPNPTAEAATAG
ncbi:MAG: hypothetical protein U0936_21535 [Planctomycetaceae bacterium]